MKKLAFGFLTLLSIFGLLTTSCSSEEKAGSGDSAGIRTYTPAPPDTSSSPTTHMDTSKKPPQ